METTTVRVALPSGGSDRSYDVVVRDGVLDELGGTNGWLPQTNSLFIVTDSNVCRFYGEKLQRRLSKGSTATGLVAFPAGEARKNIQTASSIASKLSRLGADRESLILALGGGVVGDLAGFVASIYKRGVNYVQLPTTLLAQVDSSIGGKTGLDAPWGKNQLGTLHQPKAVLADPVVLKTLPRRQILNGFAEIVKCAIVADRNLFDRVDTLKKFDSDIPRDVIVDACRVKARVVSEDERETNFRSILNFGHTVGHAFETLSSYKLGHGESVVLGMIAEGWLSYHAGILGARDYEAQSRLLRRLAAAFNVRPPRVSKSALIKLALADKKSSAASIRMSLPAGTGRMHTTESGSYRIPVSKKDLEASTDFLQRHSSWLPG